MNILLMCEDEVVMVINHENDFQIIREDLLPFYLKNRINHCKQNPGLFDETNNSLFTHWLASRTLLLSRRHAKKLFQAYRLEQSDDELTRAKLSLMCRALSILDNYWVKNEDDNIKWSQVNLRHVHLNEAVAQIALHGTSLSLEGSLSNTPEFLTNGSYAKCWKRRNDGLWLYKANDPNGNESEVEVEVSNILDRCNVEHCHYEAAEDEDLFVCACPTMTNDNISIVDGTTYTSFLNRQGIDVERQLAKEYPDQFYKMLVVDYLIANIDRHSQNWGMYFDPKTTNIIGMHPLFDHNNAFDIKAMKDEGYKSHFGNSKSLKEMALYAVKRTDFHFTKQLTKDLFISKEHYDCFMKRAEQLGIELKPKITASDIISTVTKK